ncbi:MAG: Uma2 family endonuclease [Planctomycetota bacterium]
MSTALRISSEEYDRMIQRGAFVGIAKKIELIHGELREMNPAGPIHEDCIDYLTRWSVESTIGSGVVVRVQNSIFADDSRPEPDVTWLQPGRYADRHPNGDDVLLLIEVADSTLAYDSGEKLAIYARQCIAEYWIVDVQQCCIHVYTQPHGDGYKQHHVASKQDSIRPLCRPTAELTLENLFIA